MSEINTAITTVKLNGATVKYREDKIIHIHYNGLLLSLQETKNIIKNVRDKSPWKVSPIYISAEPFSDHDSDAQEYLASEEVMSHCSAVGVLAKNLAQKISINFFIRFRKPIKPTRFFLTEEAAITWLRGFETY